MPLPLNRGGAGTPRDLDLHPHDRTYTWSNELEHPTLVHLDRALASLEPEEQFNN
jgi:hypothetical protein